MIDDVKSEGSGVGGVTLGSRLRGNDKYVEQVDRVFDELSTSQTLLGKPAVAPFGEMVARRTMKTNASLSRERLGQSSTCSLTATHELSQVPRARSRRSR
jgi:hypothetical protein